MKRLTSSLLICCNWVLASLLVLMGYSCSENVEEYGSPHADYTLKGKVVNQGGTPIPGIEIKVVSSSVYDDSSYHADSNYPYQSLTDSKGEYTVNIGSSPGKKLTLYSTDIDGELNGSFRSDTTFIDSSTIELSGGKNWYWGKGEVTLDITLQEKKTEEEDIEE